MDRWNIILLAAPYKKHKNMCQYKLHMNILTANTMKSYSVEYLVCSANSLGSTLNHNCQEFW